MAEAEAVMATIRCKVCGHHNPPEARFCANCASNLPSTSFQLAPTVAASKEPATQEVSIEYMGFWIRFGAWIIDWLIFVLVFLVFRAFSFMYLPIPFIYIVILLYFWLFTGLKGQTPGKMAFGIKVVNINNDVPGLGYAALREIIGKFLIAIIPLVVIFSYIRIAVDRENQGWHDKIAGTHVIKAIPGSR